MDDFFKEFCSFPQTSTEASRSPIARCYTNLPYYCYMMIDALKAVPGGDACCKSPPNQLRAQNMLRRQARWSWVLQPHMSSPNKTTPESMVAAACQDEADIGFCICVHGISFALSARIHFPNTGLAICWPRALILHVRLYFLIVTSEQDDQTCVDSSQSQRHPKTYSPAGRSFGMRT